MHSKVLSKDHKTPKEVQSCINRTIIAKTYLDKTKLKIDIKQGDNYTKSDQTKQKHAGSKTRVETRSQPVML